MFAACLMAAYDTGRSKAVDDCDSGDRIRLSDRICIGFAMYVYAIMLSMLLIVVSANIDAMDPSVRIQHVAPRQYMACGVWCVGTQVPLSRLLPPISFVQELGPTTHRLCPSSIYIWLMDPFFSASQSRPSPSLPLVSFLACFVVLAFRPCPRIRSRFLIQLSYTHATIHPRNARYGARYYPLPHATVLPYSRPITQAKTLYCRCP